MRLQSLGPGREQRMCSGCGSKAWGEVRVGVRGERTLQKKIKKRRIEPNKLSVPAVEFIILLLKGRGKVSTMMRSGHLFQHLCC